jgi:hypothetical protein
MSLQNNCYQYCIIARVCTRNLAKFPRSVLMPTYVNEFIMPVSKGKSRACARVGMCMYVYLLTFSMLHYIEILHALGLSIHNMVTCIYNLCTISSIFYRYSKFTSSFLIYCVLLFNLLSTALLTK